MPSSTAQETSEPDQKPTPIPSVDPDPTATAEATQLPDGSLRLRIQGKLGTRELTISGLIQPRLFAGTFNTTDALLYSHSGDNFPTTIEEETRIAVGASITTSELYTKCQEKYPALVIPYLNGGPLTQDQRQSNSTIMADCLYKDFGSKPYWVPQYIDDVDICGKVLGDGWHLPTEAEVAAIPDNVRATMLAQEAYLGPFSPYVRANDGTLNIASLGPGDRTLRGFPMNSGMPYSPKEHYESGGQLGCFHN